MPDPKPKGVKEVKAQAAKLNPSVSPPQGYTLEDFKGLPDNSDVPAFIQSGIDMSKVRQVPAAFPSEDPNHSVIAYVQPSKPYDVNVVQPDIYGPALKNHELTHTFQLTRNPALGETSAPLPDDNRLSTAADYDYGGVEGLQKAQLARKTITNFNAEQQAQIVKDYKATQDKYLAKAKAGTLTDADKKALYQAHQAYHPMVKQLAAMPGKEVNLSPSLLDMALGRNLPTIDIKPEVPGLPDYSVKGMGVVPADPLLGGRSVSLATNTVAHKIGETKRFPNGKTGRWDGHGWVAQ